MGPHQLRSWADPHDYMDFDLLTLVQGSGAEPMIETLLSGGEVKVGSTKAALYANDLSFQKGYLPVFEEQDGRYLLCADAVIALRHLFQSETWLTRDRSKSRIL